MARRIETDPEVLEARRLKKLADNRLRYATTPQREAEARNAANRAKWNKDSESEETRAKRIILSRAWKKNNPERVKELNQKSRERRRDHNREVARRHNRENAPKRFAKKLAKYWITKEDFDRIFISQGMSCGCCHAAVPGNRGWNVDHDHVTGLVRGILCCTCNLNIGALGDSVHGVMRAVDYLVKHYGPCSEASAVDEHY